MVLIGPSSEQPCGIRDYSIRLYEALKKIGAVDYRTFADSERLDLSEYVGILVQYEASLVPHPKYLENLGEKYPGTVFVVPHEVYREDPFAFPYHQVTSRWPFVSKLKKFKYRMEHQAYFKEKQLQSEGYRVHRVLPLSQHTSQILKEMDVFNLGATIPHAFERKLFVKNPPRSILSSWRSKLFTSPPKFLLGVYGFLTPAVDYTILFEALKKSPPEVALLLVGGDRGFSGMEEKLKSEILQHNLMNRVKITGYVGDNDLRNVLSMCDGFVCPFKFKSNSGSMLGLFSLNRPILASSIPLCQELKKSGGPIELYGDLDDIVQFCEEGLKGELEIPDNRYPYDFETVAGLYFKEILKK